MEMFAQQMSDVTTRILASNNGDEGIGFGPLPSLEQYEKSAREAVGRRAE
jgi:hypothetical protein